MTGDRIDPLSITCPHCAGFASLADGAGGIRVCPRCGGTGRVPTDEPLSNTPTEHDLSGLSQCELWGAFHELRYLRDRLESKSANGAGSRVITVDQMIAFLLDLPDEETADGN